MGEPRLPDLLRTRLGVPPRATALAAAAVVLLAAAAAVARLAPDGPRFVREAAPAFWLAYSPVALRPATARPGELMRLEGRHRRLRLRLVARRLRLPPYRGNSATGLLPVAAAARARRLARELDGFAVRAEGLVRIGDAYGYELQFRAGRRVAGRELLLLPGEGPLRDGVVLEVRQRRTARLRAVDRERLGLVRVALRSFEFGKP